MSKAKKIISILLSVALVLTVAPVSVFASAVNYTYGEITTSASNFTVDTSATTEVIRVAAGSDSFSLGTTIVPATPSGIPSTSGTYAAVGYAGETPVTPTVTFTIDGATLGETPSVASSLGGNISFGEMTSTTSGTKTTYSWPISTGTATAGTDVVFTITYKVNGTTYTAYAFSHVENILVMNGFLTYKEKKNNDTGSVNSRHSLIVQYQSKNMYSQMCSDSTVSNRKVGYINYATREALSGQALLGCGSETDLDGSVNAYGSVAPNGNITGDEVGALIKSVANGTTGTRYNMCVANDSNRGEPKIYIDKRNENLRTLNFRMTMQAAEGANFTRAFVAGVYFFDYKYTWGERDDPATGNASSSIITASNLYAGPSGSLYANARGEWTMTEISGTGPALTTTTESYNYSVVTDLTSNDTGNTNKAAGGMNLDFYVYNTTDLYNVFKGVMAGSGSYTTSYMNYISGGTNTSVTFNKGKNPQSSMYSSGWSNFETAYKNAGNILVKPDTNQTEINNATAALINAYNGLSGYNATVSYSVKHYITGTTTEIIPSQDYAYAAGTTVVARAATIEGYSNSGDTTKTRTLSGLQASETEAFYYTPKNYNLTIYSNGSAGTKVVSTAFDTLVDLSTLEHGTREYYTFAGWYYDSEFTQPASNFNMPASDVKLYGKWDVTPININCILIADGTELETRLLGTVTPSDSGPVSYYKPADIEKEGYLFVEYYSDAELTTLVNWPMSFNLGDSDATIYARLVDVNGRIVFETNGGTPVEDITFTAPFQPTAPTPPTKTGYSFYKWYYDSALTQEVDWNKTLTNNTGFIAYAGWTANQYTISFDMGTPASSYDTTTEQMNTMTGYANAPVAAEDVPADPVKFGYTFDHWNIKGTQTRYDFVNYPTENITLVPVWNATSYSAFIDIDSYEKVSGQYVPVTAAQTGDIVTFRMKSLTNFYTGSSVFVFMYDSRFFELVDSDASAFIVNQNSEYISGINAKVNGVTNDSLLSWPNGLDSANYDAMMVTIDPTVSLDNYNTEPMSDGEWIVEFRLRVKSTATGSGKVYMDNAWTRTPDNVMGTMFYGWSAKSSSVADTTNNVVIPNLDNAYAVITIDESVTPDTTVNLDANNGAFSDGTTTKTYTGRAEQEIVGYTSPTREGYTLTGWVKNDDNNVTWAEGYYTTEALNGSTFVAQWTPIEYDVNFYDELVDGTLKYSTKVGYETPINEPPTVFTKVGYVFDGWVDDEGVSVTLPVNCPLGGMNLYATWAPATDTAYKIVATATRQDTGASITVTSNMTGTTGYTVKIVETVPGTPEADTIYVTYDQLPTMAGGNYHFDADNNPAEISAVIAPDGSTVINVNYIANTIVLTFDANGGQFSDGLTTKTISGLFQAVVAADQNPGEPTKDGYDFAGWNPTFTAGTTKFTRDQTYTAKWTAKEFAATFNANGGYFDGDTSTTEKVVNIKYGSAITAPSTNPAKEGYNFLGWASTDTATAAEALGTMDSTSGKTFYAVYALADFTVTYFVDGAEKYTETYHMGDAVTIRAAESKTGYTFSGWKINGVDAAGFTMPAADVEIEGTFTANTYDVIFDANGGYFDGNTSITQKAVPTAFDTAIVAPATAPARSGYEFLGWAATAESKTLITNFGNLTTVDTVTYYAVWNALNADYTVEIYYQDTTGAYPAAADESYTYSGLVESTVSYTHEDKTGFTFDSVNSVESGTVSAETPLVLVIKYIRNQYALSTDVDGTVTKVADYYYGAAVAEPDAPSKEGYTFTGWSNLPSTMPANDVTVTATWQVNQYNVKFYADEAKTEVVYDQNLNYGSSMPDPTATKEGYTLAGWAYAGTTDIVDLSTVTVPAQAVEFVAIWQVNQYDMIYRTYNGVYQQYKVNYGEAPTVPENPTRVGYTFTGWNPSVPDTMPARTVTVAAQWQINQYTITFADTGDTVIDPITQDYGTDVYAPDDPEKTGYTFAGWDTEIPATMPAGDMTITAQWTVNQYTITFANTGDSVIAPITQDYGTAITAPENPTKEGYTFAGWDTEVPATMPAGDMTITAKWTVNQYTITFANTGDSVIAPITQDYGTAIIAPQNPTKEGYTFAGWDVSVPATMPAGDMTITAQWTINQYTITFNTDGGSEVAPITQDYATAVAAPQNPTKTGYTFAGWSPEVPATMPAENVTVTAQWTINQYSITFDTDGGSTINPITQDYGTAVTPPENPTKEGYTFISWDKEIPATMPAENVTIKAQWQINQYTITFANTGDTVINPITQDYGTAVTAPENPTKIGYTFDGWDVAVPATMPAGNMTITAKWKINQYTITFETDGGSEVAPITQDYATAVTAPENPTKTGYTFLGWSEEVPATMPAENKTLTAQWQINQYKVTFLDAEGGVFSESTLDYGAAIVAPADAPAKQYYTFSGWSLDGTTVSADLGTVPANNVEITPIFERVPVELKPADGSNAIIKVEDDVSTPKTGFIYGLDTRLTENKLLSDYLAVEGDGRIEVTLTKFNVCGTGTRIDVYDNVTNAIVATYYIIIFGDINGDAEIDSLDTSMLDSEIAGKTMWHINDPDNAQYDQCKVLAADLDNGGTDGAHDGYITAVDATLLDAVTLEIAEIDQQTGNVTYY